MHFSFSLFFDSGTPENLTQTSPANNTTALFTLEMCAKLCRYSADVEKTQTVAHFPLNKKLY